MKPAYKTMLRRGFLQTMKGKLAVAISDGDLIIVSKEVAEENNYKVLPELKDAVLKAMNCMRLDYPGDYDFYYNKVKSDELIPVDAMKGSAKIEDRIPHFVR